MYSRMAARAAARVAKACAGISSVLSVEKRLSAAALSQQLPRRLMLCPRPWRESSDGYASLAYGLPRSV